MEHRGQEPGRPAILLHLWRLWLLAWVINGSLRGALHSHLHHLTPTARLVQAAADEQRSELEARLRDVQQKLAEADAKLQQVPATFSALSPRPSNRSFNAAWLRFLRSGLLSSMQPILFPCMLLGWPACSVCCVSVPASTASLQLGFTLSTAPSV